MKRLAGLLALMFSTQQIASANYRSILADQINFSRSPYSTEQTLDSDIRLRTMGSLSLPIEDEANLIGTYKYGDFAAGIPLDYDQAKFEFQYYNRKGEVDDNGRSVNNFQGQLADTGQSSTGFMGYFPFKYGRFGVGGLTLSKKWHYSDYEYTGSATNAFGVSPVTVKDSIRDFTMGYGHRFNCGFLAGLNIEHRIDYEKEEIGTSKDDFKTYNTEISPSIGYQWKFQNERYLTLVGGPRFIEMDDETASPFIEEDDIDGMKLGAGLLYQSGKYLRIGGFVDAGQLDGERSLNGNNIGEQELERSKINLRGYYQIPNNPFSFGVLYESSKRNITDKNNAGTTVGDDDVKRSALGFGVAYHWNTKGLLGFEYQALKAEQTDNLFPNSSAVNRDEKGGQFSIGGEYSLNDAWKLRAGLQTYNVDTDPVGTPPEASLSGHEFTLGAGYQLKAWEFDLGLFLAKDEQDGVQSLQEVEEQKSTGFQFLSTYRWGGVRESF